MLEIKHRFPADVASAAAARRAVEGLLAASSPVNLENARIVVSELITYSILNSTHDHTGWIDLTLQVSRAALRIDIVNSGSGFGAGEALAPVSKEEALAEPARSIVEGLTDDWGTDPANGIWAVLPWGRNATWPTTSMPNVRFKTAS